MSTTTALTIRDRLNSPAQMQEIARALPKHMSADRMARVAITALTKTPALNECEPASFFKCLLDLSAMGLEPDGRRAHLIPFRNNKRNVTECQLIVDYKGLVELAYRSGEIASIHTDVFCEGEEFVEDRGKVLSHRIDRSKPRTKPLGAYCVVTFKSGSEKHEVMGLHEIEAIRKRSRSGSSGPWVTDWSEMARKTVFRRASKWLPLSSEILEAFDRDDDRLEIPEPRTKRPSGMSFDELKTALTYETQEDRPTVLDLSTITAFEDAITQAATEDEIKAITRQAIDMRPEDNDWASAISVIADGRIAAIREAKARSGRHDQ